MNNYILVLDRGSTNIKAVIFDTEGNELYCSASPCEKPVSLNPGWSEQDIDNVWQKTVTAISQLFATTPVVPEDIIGVITSGQGNGLIAINEHNQLVRAGILSLDSRAADIHTRWIEDGRYDEAIATVGMPFAVGSPLPLLAWFKEYRRDEFNQIDTVLFSKDWLRFKLSGTKCTDLSDASGAGLVKLGTDDYAYDLFRKLDLEDIADRLPQIKPTHEVVGEVTVQAAKETGLKPGTPVLCGAHDMGAFPFGIGRIDEKQLVSVIGTWGLNVLPVKAPQGYPAVFNHTVPDYYLAGIGDGNAGGCLDIMLEHFCHDEKKESEVRNISFHQLVESKITTKINGIIFHPFIFGSLFNTDAAAGLYGLRSWHTKSDILSAIYEGIVMGYYSNIRLIPGYQNLEAIWLIGGGGKSNIFGQMFADITGLTINIPEGSEITARGCALNALVGLGICNDHQEASIPTKIKKQFKPSKERHQKYQKKFDVFNSISEKQYLIWKELNQFN